MLDRENLPARRQARPMAGIPVHVDPSRVAVELGNVTEMRFTYEIWNRDIFARVRPFLRALEAPAFCQPHRLDSIVSIASCVSNAPSSFTLQAVKELVKKLFQSCIAS